MTDTVRCLGAPRHHRHPRTLLLHTAYMHLTAPIPFKSYSFLEERKSNDNYTLHSFPFTQRRMQQLSQIHRLRGRSLADAFSHPMRNSRQRCARIVYDIGFRHMRLLVRGDEERTAGLAQCALLRYVHGFLERIASRTFSPAVAALRVTCRAVRSSTICAGFPRTGRAMRSTSCFARVLPGCFLACVPGCWGFVILIAARRDAR